LGFYRDLTKMIGDYVWKSRKNPELWGMTPEMKNQTKKIKKEVSL
jgi:hypothetical protein